MSNIRYLTKSRFKLGWECPAKLHFANHRDRYHDTMVDDTFLKGLAEGGYQVGELARWMLCRDPRGDVVESLDHERALRETAGRLEPEFATVAEAAFRHDDLFIRADVVVKDGRVLKLYEVKSVSWEEGDSFWTQRGKRRPTAKWEPYLLDVAFQKHVISRARPDLDVQAYLVVLDKGKCATVDGLNRKFGVIRDGRRIAVHSAVSSREELGEDVLAYLRVDSDLEEIGELDFDLPDGGSGRLPALIEQLAKINRSDDPFRCAVGAKCRGCQFALPKDSLKADQLRAAGIRSGLEECWRHAVGTAYDPGRPKVTELWNYRHADERIAEGRYFLEDLREGDLGEGACAPRQWLQVRKARDGDATPWIDGAGLAAQVRSWKFPLHFIDFETSRMALPGRRGDHPYTQVAFQFSHHTVASDGAIVHHGQWIEVRPGVFPSFEFVRALKRDLEGDDGTIFRYADHENTVLLDLYAQLEASAEPDRRELMDWIATVTRRFSGTGKSRIELAGGRCMVDMRKVLTQFHYDPATHGSNSLKAVLPAIIGSSAWLRGRYGQTLAGSGIHSLNCAPDWTWVRPDLGLDPYASLPPVFTGEAEAALSDYSRGLDEVDDGGAATIAYAKLQFFELPDTERAAIREALLRYCELDTLAMVMLFEYWREEVTRHGG